MSVHGRVIGRGPCPKCGSGDNLVEYEDGYKKCYGATCTHYEYASTPIQNTNTMTFNKPAPLDSELYLAVPQRGIAKQTAEKFQYMTWKGGEQLAPYFNADGKLVGQKVRWPGKRFQWYGSNATACPYGYQLWRPTHKALIIVEGEIDAMSIYQVMGDRLAVAGILNGAGPQTLSYFEKNLSLFDQFETIYLGLDNDEAGASATKDLEGLFSDRRIRLVTWKHKDPNDSLIMENPKEIEDAIIQAKLKTFDDIIDVAEFDVDRLFDSFKPGIPLTKFPKLAGMLKWLKPGNIYTVAASPKAGKLEKLDNLIATTDGFKKMVDLKIGDTLFDGYGCTTKIISKSDIQTPQKAYRLHFANGSYVDCADTHDWEIYSRSNITTKSTPTKRSAEWVSKNYKDKSGRSILYVKNPGPVNFNAKDLPIDPYVLGLWLGDGQSASGAIYLGDTKTAAAQKLATASDTYIVHRRNNCNKYRSKGLTTLLKTLGVLNNKHIPEVYLTGSIEQRLSLLRGLLDTDGSINNRKTGYEIAQKSQVLIQDIQRLLWSLGVKASIRTKLVNNTKYYRINFVNSTGYNLSFRMPHIYSYDKSARYHTITKVEEIKPEPMQCIMVDNSRHTYVTGHGCVVTHNSTFTRVLADYLVEEGYSTGLMYLESEEEEVIKDFISLKSGIATWAMEADPESLGGKENVTKILSSYAGKGLKLWDHDGQFDPSMIINRLKYMVKGLGCKVVIFDNFSISSSVLGEDLASTNQFVTQLVQLCKQTGLCLINICHLKKNVLKDRDTGEDSVVVSPSDVYGTGALNKYSSALIALEKPPSANYASLHVLSNRYGPTGYADTLYYDFDTGQLTIKGGIGV